VLASPQVRFTGSLKCARVSAPIAYVFFTTTHGREGVCVTFFYHQELARSAAAMGRCGLVETDAVSRGWSIMDWSMTAWHFKSLYSSTSG